MLSWLELNKTVIFSLQSSSPAPETTDTSADTAAGAGSLQIKYRRGSIQSGSTEEITQGGKTSQQNTRGGRAAERGDRGKPIRAGPTGKREGKPGRDREETEA